MKKFVSVLLVVIMAAMMLTGCSKKELSDWEYIKDKGEMVVGITYFEPMNYFDENGELTGFETEFAQAVAEITGVPVKFQEIEWDQKEIELKSKNIDCIWNGLTVTEERKNDMAFSTSYVENKQVIVIKKSNADKYTDVNALAGATVCAENGSAGQGAIEADEVLSQNEFIPVSAQKDALLEVKAETVQAAVIDSVYAASVINENTDYSDLMIIEGVELAKEEYAIGLRLEDTETLEIINAAIATLMQDGTLEALGKKYGVNVIVQ